MPPGALPARQFQVTERRHRDNYFFQWQHRRSEGRDADALQHRIQHRTARAGLCSWPKRQAPGSSSVFPFLWIYRHVCVAVGTGCGCCLPRQSTRCANGRGIGDGIRGNLLAGDTNVPRGIHSSLHTRAVWQSRPCFGWRREASGTNRSSLRRQIWNSAP